MAKAARRLNMGEIAKLVAFLEGKAAYNKQTGRKYLHARSATELRTQAAKAIGREVENLSASSLSSAARDTDIAIVYPSRASSNVKERVEALENQLRVMAIRIAELETVVGKDEAPEPKKKRGRPPKHKPVDAPRKPPIRPADVGAVRSDGNNEPVRRGDIKALSEKYRK